MRTLSAEARRQEIYLAVKVETAKKARLRVKLRRAEAEGLGLAAPIPKGGAAKLLGGLTGCFSNSNASLQMPFLNQISSIFQIEWLCTHQKTPGK